MHCIDTISERFRYHRKFEHSTKFAVSARSKLLFPLTTQPVIANACSDAHTQERSDEAALHREGAGPVSRMMTQHQMLQASNFSNPCRTNASNICREKTPVAETSSNRPPGPGLSHFEPFSSRLFLATGYKHDVIHKTGSTYKYHNATRVGPSTVIGNMHK